MLAYSLRASRSSSIARRLHQRLGTVEAKRHHKGGAKQGTAAWKKSSDGQCCSHSPAEKRPDRRLFPLRRGFAHHKVRVQDAKLDRLDALDGRRRVREAVHRRHDCEQEAKEREEKKSGCRRLFLSLSSCFTCTCCCSRALSRHRCSRARACALALAAERKERAERERERERRERMNGAFFFFFLPPLYSSLPSFGAAAIL